MQRGNTVDVVCRCGKTFTARVADRDRGWARSCSKSCAASKRIRDGVQRPLHLVPARRAPASGIFFDTASEDAYADHDPSWGAHENY